MGVLCAVYILEVCVVCVFSPVASFHENSRKQQFPPPITLIIFCEAKWDGLIL